VVEAARPAPEAALLVIRAVVAAYACACAVEALAQAYDVVGQCRSGVPNGAYELKLADGRVRVVGALSQGRMTGTFIFWRSGGARVAVLPLDNDARNGTVALWYTAPDGRTEAGHRLEAQYRDDRLHGVKRSWYADGSPRTALRYDHGRLVAARAWNEAGRPLSGHEARRLAARDEDADERTYASLVALVRQHLPVCEAESTG
jgi:antitoxin component YwqK of YwqJK toxin-antitoxin module